MYKTCKHLLQNLIGLIQECKNKLKDYIIDYNSLCFDDNEIAQGLWLCVSCLLLTAYQCISDICYLSVVCCDYDSY